MTRAEGPRQQGNRRQGGGDHAQPQCPRQALAEIGQVLPQPVEIGDDAMRPVQHPFAFRGQADELMAALDHRQAQLPLQFLDAGGKCRLRDIAGRRRPGEMLFPCQSHQIRKLTDEHRRLRLDCRVV